MWNSAAGANDDVKADSTGKIGGYKAEQEAIIKARQDIQTIKDRNANTAAAVLTSAKQFQNNQKVQSAVSALEAAQRKLNAHNLQNLASYAATDAAKADAQAFESALLALQNEIGSATM